MITEAELPLNPAENMLIGLTKSRLARVSIALMGLAPTTLACSNIQPPAIVKPVEAAVLNPAYTINLKGGDKNNIPWKLYYGSNYAVMMPESFIKRGHNYERIDQNSGKSIIISFLNISRQQAEEAISKPNPNFTPVIIANTLIDSRASRIFIYRLPGINPNQGNTIIYHIYATNEDNSFTQITHLIPEQLLEKYADELNKIRNSIILNPQNIT